MEQGTEIRLGAALSIRENRAPVLLLQELASANNSMSPKADSSLEAPEECSAQQPLRLQSQETPSRGLPRAYMTSDPQNYEIIKKCVLMGATKVVVICYTPRERSSAATAQTWGLLGKSDVLLRTVSVAARQGCVPAGMWVAIPLALLQS